MENIIFNISQVLGITIIHSLWQGLLVYFVTRVILVFGNPMSASKKYLVAVSALSSVTLWFSYTLFTEISLYRWIAVAPAKLSDLPLMLELPTGIHDLHGPVTRYYYSIEKYLPYITLIYVAGLLFNTGRLIIARKKISFIKRNIHNEAGIQNQVNNFAGIMNIKKGIRSGLSHLVSVPCITGFFKPIILLPFTLSTYLSASEIEAILLHELAHIKRNDYLVNIAQQVMTVLLFFNPFTYLINRIISEERENACDDMVVSATSNPVIYATALLKLEQARRQNWELTLAATGKKYNLLNRIERIMKTKKQTVNVRPTLVAMFIITIAAGCFALLKPQIAHGEISIKAAKPIIDKIMAQVRPAENVIVEQDTTPKKIGKKTETTLKNVDTVKQDNSNAYQLFGYNDPKMDSLWREYKKHSNFVNGYYKTVTYKELRQKLYGDESDNFYDNDTLKYLINTLKNTGKYISENYGVTDGRLKDINNELTSLGLKIGAYYSSDEFKTLNRQLQEKYTIAADRDYSGSTDVAYQKYQAELKSRIPQEVREQTSRVEDIRAQMAKEYSSPDFTAAIKRIHEIGDSLKLYNTKTHVKQHEVPNTKSTFDKLPAEERKLYTDQITAYKNNPEYKRESELLKECMDQMWAYMRTPVFLKHEQEWKNHLKTVMGNDYNIIANPEKKNEK